MTGRTAVAPGRVNLIGEHTDYNDGLALPFAIEEHATVRAEPIEGEELVARALDLGEEDRFDPAAPTGRAGRPEGAAAGGAGPPAGGAGRPEGAVAGGAGPPEGGAGRPEGAATGGAGPPEGGAARPEGWRAFVHGTVEELRATGVEVRPAELTIESTVPSGGGLSSSAALTVALALALGANAGDRIALAKLCSRVENLHVGANTGLLDQLASLFGEPGHALRIDFRSLQVTPVPLDLKDHTLVILDSGETHDLAASGYNERRAECDRAKEILKLESLRDATLDQAATLPDPLDRRIRHVITENARVDKTVNALTHGHLDAIGPLLDASHASLRDDYAASTEAVERTVTTLKTHGARGARMMGGGFGGNVLALFPPTATPPEPAREVRPASGARIV